MFIKRTRVKTASGIRTYLQLVHSYHDGSRYPRHHLVANLGPADDIDLEVAQRLAISLNHGTKDSLPPEEIALLHPKRYGDVRLLYEIYKKIGLDRFFYNIGVVKYDDPTLSENLFELLAYTVLKHEEQISFFDFLDSILIRRNQNVPMHPIRSIVRALDIPNLMSSALQSIQSPPAKQEALHFFCNVRSNLFPGALQRCWITARTPYHVESISLVSGDMPTSVENFVIGEWREGEDRFFERLGKSGTRFCVWIKGKSKSPQLQRIMDVAQEGGQFEPWAQRGVREKWVDGHRLFIIRPTPGITQDDSHEARDIWVTNSNDDWASLGPILLFYERLAEHLYSIDCPPEVCSLPTCEDRLKNLVLLKLSCLCYMEEQLEYDWLAEDLLDILSSIQGVYLTIRNQKRLFHSEFSPEISSLLKKLDVFGPHMYI